MPKAMIITVGTGREGKDIAQGICFSITQHNPEYLLFIVTKKSEEITMPFVLRNNAMQKRQYELKYIENENDVEKIYQDCLHHINEIFAKGYHAAEIVADYTAGTKAMSSGLCLAAIALGVGSLSYVYGDRDEGGRTIPGTERIISLKPIQILIDAKVKAWGNLFNLFQFEACLSIIEDIKVMTQKPEVLSKLSVMENLTSAYAAWDKFNHQKAFELLQPIKNINLTGWSVNLGPNKEFLGKLLHNQLQSPVCQIADLLNNAQRRISEGKYDDAVARLYRITELLAQYKLNYNYNGLNTANLQIEQLPKPLQDKYEQLRDAEGKIRLGLHKAYGLLADLGDELGTKFRKDKELKNLLKARSDSILAHGLKPIDKDTCELLFNKVKNYANEMIPKLDKLIQKTQFPKLKF